MPLHRFIQRPDAHCSLLEAVRCTICLDLIAFGVTPPFRKEADVNSDARLPVKNPKFPNPVKPEQLVFAVDMAIGGQIRFALGPH